MTGQHAEGTERQDILFEHQETLLNCENDWALRLVAREVEEFPSLEIFKSCLAVVLGNLILVALLSRWAAQVKVQNFCAQILS